MYNLSLREKFPEGTRVLYRIRLKIKKTFSELKALWP